MSDYGPLKAPSAQAIEVFRTVLKNNPDADVRAIPNQWLLNERALSAKLGAEIELLTKSRDSFREACHRYSNGPLEAG